MSIGFDTILNVAQLRVKLLADRTGLAILRNNVTLVFFQVVDTADGTDYCRCATSACFFHFGEFFNGNLAAFYLKSEVESQLLKALVGDRGEDRT